MELFESRTILGPIASHSPHTPTDLAEAAHALARLSRHLEHALHDVSLTLPQYRLLLFLSNRADAANRLASRLHVRPPSLTALVDGMESRGLVERRPDPTDRRRVQIVITAAGTKQLAAANAAAAGRLAGLEERDPNGSDLISGLAAWQTALDHSLHERLQR